MNTLSLFWLYYPGLYYGLSFLLGIYCQFYGWSTTIIPCFFLWLPIAFKRMDLFLLGFITFLTAFASISLLYTFPSLPEEGIPGIASIQIKNISLQPSPFGKQWVYRSEIEDFIPNQSSVSIARNVPCLIIFKSNENRPKATCNYWVRGTLKKKNGHYFFKVSTKTQWEQIPNTESRAEDRFHWKKKVSQWIKSKYIHRISGSFLAGLLTGDFDDYWMKEQLGRFGLQHLLAISGFHFALIAAFLSLFFRFFFRLKLRVILLIVSLTAYCYFLGPQPSILRAWIMCLILLASSFFEKEGSSLNALGLSILLIASYDPLLTQGLGFQFSFAITAAILLFFQPAEIFSQFLFPKRTLSEVIKMNALNQYAYCILVFFRQGLSLTLAVNIIALPFSLYYFHQFSWMSLLYNFFFPFFASGSLCLLLLGGIFSFIPLLGNTIHMINNWITFYLLQLAYQTPPEMDFILRIPPIQSLWMAAYFSMIFLLGIHLNKPMVNRDLGR